MELVCAILIAPLVAGYLASLLCRLSLRRDRRPSWFVIPLAVAIGVVLTWLVTFQQDLFHPSRWSSKVEGSDMLAFAGVPAAVLAVVVALPIVGAYYDKYAQRHTKP
jgi:hypothetical protein